jgi:hypothetical protein
MSQVINAFLAGQEYRNQLNQQQQQAQAMQEQRGMQNTAAKVQGALMQGDRELAQNLAIGSGNADIMGAFRDQVSTMDTQERARQQEIFGVVGSVANSLRDVPVEQRSIAFRSEAPRLMQMGVPAEEIERYDQLLSDPASSDAVLAVLSSRVTDAQAVFDAYAPQMQAENEVLASYQGGRLTQGPINPNAESNRAIERQNADTSRMNAVTDRRRFEMDEAAAGQPSWGDINSLRDDAEGMIASYRKVEEAYSRIAASAQDPSAAGDLALIFNYMKMLDPGSTVREGEFATAQNAGGVDQRVQSFYNRIVNGERLTPDQRADFVRRAEMLFGQQQRVAQERIAPFAEQAEQRGFPTRQAVPQFVSPPEMPALASMSDEELERIANGGN